MRFTLVKNLISPDKIHDIISSHIGTRFETIFDITKIVE